MMAGRDGTHGKDMAVSKESCLMTFSLLLANCLSTNQICLLSLLLLANIDFSNY